MGTQENTAAIYVRRSAFDAGNKEEDAFSRSLQAQERECQSWAERQGMTVTQVYRDKTGTSASHFKTNRRPEMERALSEIGSRYKTLIVWAFDRATRKGIAEAGAMLETVETAGGRLVSVTDGVDTDDPTARLIIAIRAEMARDEMTKLSTRVNRGKDEQRRRGEYLGGSLPYGVLRDEDADYGVSIDHDAADVLRKAADRLTKGASLRETCETLNVDGHRTSAGGAWSASTLRRTLLAPHMLGQRYYKKQDTYAVDEEGNRLIIPEPILTEAQFSRVKKAISARARLTNNCQRTQTSTKRHASPLGGLIRCAECLSTMATDSTSKTLATGERRYYGSYRCAVCRKHTINLRGTNDYVARAALNYLGALDPESAIVEEVGRRWLARFSPEQANRHSEILDEVDALEGRHRELQSNYYERGTMDTIVFERLDRKLAGEIADLRDEMRDTPTPQADLSALLDMAQSADNPEDIVGPGSAWANLDVSEQREIMRVLVDQVTVERTDDRYDFNGRLTIEFATESNVIDLANRGDRIVGKHVSRAAKTA